MSSNCLNFVDEYGYLHLRNLKENVLNTDGINTLVIYKSGQLVSTDELKNVIKSINISKLVDLCIEMDNAEDILRIILEIHPNLASQLQKIVGKNNKKNSTVKYTALKCKSFKVFSDYEFPLVKDFYVDELPDTHLTGLPNATIHIKNIIIDANTCEILNKMRRCIISESDVHHMPSCEWMRFIKCNFEIFDEKHKRNGWTKSMGFVDCDGDLPSITFKAVTSMSVEQGYYKEFKLNKCKFPNIDECFIIDDEAFDTSIISNVKKLTITGCFPITEPCVNLEQFYVYNASTDVFEDMKSIKTKDILIKFNHDEDWYPTYKAEQLATIDTSKLKSVSITGAEAIGDIGPLKRKFEEAGVESCIITITKDILKKTKTS